VLDASHPAVVQMVTDSLRYWAEEMQVDGFRFDLASILGRRPSGYDERSGFLAACRQDPALSRLKLIAEPWDVGPGGYQLGNFPPGWAEWNDRYRDTVRAFWKGDFGQRGDLASRLCGTTEHFNRRGRRPWASINFITAHDGFTLNDLVSYDSKHNDANGEDNRDGTDNNLSWNHGAEGPTTDPQILMLREQQKRNLLATLLFSQGTPMVLAGDEFGHSQGGNNNAYAQDNEISWIDWAAITDEGRLLRGFTERLIQLRNRYPLLRQKRFLSGAFNSDLGVKDVTWLNTDGTELTTEHWLDPGHRCLGMLLDGRAQSSGIRQRGAEITLLLLVNAHDGEVEFSLPEVPDSVRWRRLVDTRAADAEESLHEFGQSFALGARCLSLFVAERAPLPPAGS
jgi:isoamylase